ncbi:hypothetical protein Agub_g12035, partial [Astrephomene gubernaculifera]
MAAYDPDCLFSDPFVSFRGTERFKRNVANLGAPLSDIRIDIVDWEEGPACLTARWRFSALLPGLPWRPRLAAAGSTTHVLDLQRGRVVRHEERWDLEPGRVLVRLLRPSAPVPSNRWEALMMPLSRGDLPACWEQLSPLLAAAAAGVLGLHAAAAWGAMWVRLG